MPFFTQQAELIFKILTFVLYSEPGEAMLESPKNRGSVRALCKHFSKPVDSIVT
jgi:hypothetical protein